MCSLFSCLFYTSLLIHAHRHNVNFLFRKSLVRLRSNQSELSVNTSKESYTIAFLSIQIDKYEISLLIVNSNTIILTAHTSYYYLRLWINMITWNEGCHVAKTAGKDLYYVIMSSITKG